MMSRPLSYTCIDCISAQSLDLSKVIKLLKTVSTEICQEDKSEKLLLVQQLGPNPDSIWQAKSVTLIL